MREIKGKDLQAVNMEYYRELEDNISVEEMNERYINTLKFLADLVPQINSYSTTLGELDEQSKKSA